MPEISDLLPLEVEQTVDEIAGDLALDVELCRQLVAELLDRRVVYLPPIVETDPSIAPDAEARMTLARFKQFAPADFGDALAPDDEIVGWADEPDDA